MRYAAFCLWILIITVVSSVGTAIAQKGDESAAQRPTEIVVAYDGIQPRWSQAEANRWYTQFPWLVGCNFIPSSAINQLEMWQIFRKDGKPYRAWEVRLIRELTNRKAEAR